MWLLLPTTGRTYNEYIAMPRSAPGIVERELPVPDTISVISRMLGCGYHLRSWSGLAAAGAGAWSMLTTSLTEACSRPAVPVWSGDAVVLAGTWTRAHAVRAVELVALSALAGTRPPTVVIPVLTGRRDGAGSAAGQIPLARTVAETLAAAGGTRRSVMVTTDVTHVTPEDGMVLDEVRAAVMGREASEDVLTMSDTQWDVLSQVLPPEPYPPRRGPRPDIRRHMLGALWQLRTRGFWCNLPRELGDWQMVYRQWQRWEADGTLDALLRLITPFPAGGPALRGLPSSSGATLASTVPDHALCPAG